MAAMGTSSIAIATSSGLVWVGMEEEATAGATSECPDSSRHPSSDLFASDMLSVITEVFTGRFRAQEHLLLLT